MKFNDFTQLFDQIGATWGISWGDFGGFWHHFWDQFRYLGVTFGSFWMHFLCQKTDWGAKGAQRGATPEINSPIWAPFGSHFSYIL